MAVFYRSFSTWEGKAGIWLEDLFVRPEYRRSGLARELLDALRARTSGRVEWAVLDWNARAIAFYERVGFGVVGERKFQVGATVHDDLILALDL